MGLNANILTKQQVCELLKDVLKKEDLDGHMEISSGSKKGDGYLSCMTKVAVVANGKMLHLIIKCAPKEEQFRKFVPVIDIYSREIYFYNEILPSFIKFQEERNIDEPFNAVVHCYKTQISDCSELLVMDNIKEGQGFELWDKRQHMDAEHVITVFKEYGKFHAISFAMQDQNPELYAKLTNNMKDIIHKFNPDFYAQLKSSLEKVKELFPDENQANVIEALEKLKNEVELFYIRLGTEDAKYNVVNHGDCWCNNMMFKYEEKTRKLKEIKLLDFQLMRTSSPANDLGYFIYVSTGKDIYNNLDYYLRIYYDSLSNHTKALGSEIEKLYPYEALLEDWKYYCRFGLLMSINLLKAVLMEGDEIIDILDIPEDAFEDFSFSGFKNEELANERIRNVILHAVKNEYI